jgi:uroporphyrinogen-III synthase
MRRVLVLRPEPGASETLERLRQHGLDGVAVPLFEVEPIAWSAPEPAQFDGLLLTSANALRHGAAQLQGLHGLPVYVVGQATAEAARQAGFEVAAIGESGVDALLTAIEPGLRLLHLCGEDRMAHSEPRHEISILCVYRARELEAPNLDCAPGSVALIHSPRAGRRFAQLIANRSSILVAAISAAAAQGVGSGWEAVETAAQPSDEALLALAARLCDRSSPQ